jgi:SecD/SecF fusion protein
VGNRRTQLILVGLVLAALVGVAIISVPGSPVRQKPTLGLDLKGGLEVTLQAVPPEPGQELTEEDLDRSVEIIRNRVDKLGVSEPEVRKQDPDQIAVALAGVFDVARASEIIGKTAKLELYDLQKNLVRPVSIDSDSNPIPQASLHNLLASGGIQSRVEKDGAEEYYLFNKKKRQVGDPAPTRADLLKERRGKLP